MAGGVEFVSAAAEVTGLSAQEIVTSVRSAFGSVGGVKASRVNNETARQMGVVKDSPQGDGMGVCMAGGVEFVAAAAEVTGLSAQEIVTSVRSAFAQSRAPRIGEPRRVFEDYIRSCIQPLELSNFMDNIFANVSTPVSTGSVHGPAPRWKNMTVEGKKIQIDKFKSLTTASSVITVPVTVLQNQEWQKQSWMEELVQFKDHNDQTHDTTRHIVITYLHHCKQKSERHTEVRVQASGTVTQPDERVAVQKKCLKCYMNTVSTRKCRQVTKHIGPDWDKDPNRRPDQTSRNTTRTRAVSSTRHAGKSSKSGDSHR